MTFNCFGKLDAFFKASLQKYKLKKVSCENIERTIGQYTTDKFFTIFLMQLNRDIFCKDKCGKCFKENALFLFGY
jgi:hypothetical protein